MSAEQAAELFGTPPDPSKLAYLASLFTRTSLPYKDPGPVSAWTRRNGDWVMTLQPQMTERDGQSVPIGLPFGVMPRLLLTWMCSEAYRRKTPLLSLGPSLRAFMAELGQEATGGKNGTITRMRVQAERLFGSTLSVRWEGDGKIDLGGRINIASAWQLFWSDKKEAPDGQLALLDSHVRLSADLYEQVIKHPVPLDPRALAVFRSPMEHDIYAWATYRFHNLERLTPIPWSALWQQFGSNFADTKQGRYQFKRDFTRHLETVKKIYPEANIDVTDKGLVLRPSSTHVLPKGAHAARAFLKQRTVPARRAVPDTKLELVHAREQPSS